MHELNELIALHNPNELENIFNISDPLNTDLIHIVRKMDPHVIMLFNGGRLRNKLKLIRFQSLLFIIIKRKRVRSIKPLQFQFCRRGFDILKNKTKSD